MLTNFHELGIRSSRRGRGLAGGIAFLFETLLLFLGFFVFQSLERRKRFLGVFDAMQAALASWSAALKAADAIGTATLDVVNAPKGEWEAVCLAELER